MNRRYASAPDRQWPGILIVIAALVVGTIDVLAAALYWQASIPKTFQSIAAWVIGRDAYHLGAYGTVLGAMLQYLLMTAIVAGYHVAAHRYPALLKHPMIGGACYGALVYAVQFGVAVPLSRAPSIGFHSTWILACLSVYVLVVGITAAFIAKAARHAIIPVFWPASQ